MTEGSSASRAASAPSAAETLSRTLIALEIEESGRRLTAFDCAPDVAAEIAVRLAQSTDLPLFIDDIAQALRREALGPSSLSSTRSGVGVTLDLSARLARLIGLPDLFSINFRIDADAGPTFFEFEVCPGVTIYDFQSYLRSRLAIRLRNRCGWRSPGGRSKARLERSRRNSWGRCTVLALALTSGDKCRGVSIVRSQCRAGTRTAIRAKILSASILSSFDPQTTPPRSRETKLHADGATRGRLRQAEKVNA
jgi:hypothetical protein